MIHELARNWGFIALRGALAVVFGVIAFFEPASAFAALVLLFGAYAFVDGVFALIALFRGAGKDRFWVLVLEAVVGIGIGILTIAQPAATALALLYYVGIWAILTGIFELVAAIACARRSPASSGSGWRESSPSPSACCCSPSRGRPRWR